MRRRLHAMQKGACLRSPVVRRDAALGRRRSLAGALEVQLHLAASSDRLDLSESELKTVPPDVFELRNLTELSLSGNALRNLSPQISNLTELQKLQISGNLLEALPEEVAALTKLKGLWAHGNLLQSLPEGLGALQSLQKVSLSGNRLVALPASLSQLKGLVELELGGNQLKKLPNLMGLDSLEKLILHGNALTEVTDSVLFCSRLGQLALQGNAIRQIDVPHCFFPQGLKSLNLADNGLRILSCDISNLTALEHLTLYGNELEVLPEGLLDLPRLKSVWLEGNPLSRATLETLLEKRPVKVGLDQLHEEALEGVGAVRSMISFSQVPIPYRKGYCKLLRNEPGQQAEMLVVAFGSAPGMPNWGSVLRKAKAGQKPKTPKFVRVGRDPEPVVEPEIPPLGFDILFVVDPSRSWYGVGTSEFASYASTLREMTQPYSHCVMIGDSMGASAALLFSEMATSVIAFCPQIDLSTASIRPGSSPEIWNSLKAQILRSTQSTPATLQVVTGTWSHDVTQARHLNLNKADHCVMHVNSHRLTAHLERSQRLVPFVRAALEKELCNVS